MIHMIHYIDDIILYHVTLTRRHSIMLQRTGPCEVLYVSEAVQGACGCIEQHNDARHIGDKHHLQDGAPVR